MSQTKDFDRAVSVLKLFFEEMNQWGLKAVRHLDALMSGNMTEETLQQDRMAQRQDARVIFLKYCNAGDSSPRFQDAGMSFSNPPEYDPNLERILSCTLSKANILITTKHPYVENGLNKYTLISKNSDWYIADKHYSFNKGKSWSKGYL